MFELVGRLQQYKRATASFLRWLAGLAPPKARRAREILLAAQRVAASGVAVPATTIVDLQRAISLRKQVYLMYGDKDARHAYFIELLEEVKNILLASSAAGSDGETPPPLKVDVEALANRFEKLVIEESPDGPTAQPFLIGAAVRIHSLKGKPELNGKMGYSSKFIAAKGRYCVKIGAEEMLLKPDNLFLVAAEEEEESFILGETAEIGAMFLLQDLQTALEAVETAWDDYKEGKCTLLAATALTNACIRHAERLASETEINHPELSSLERVVTVAHMADAIRWVAGEFVLPFDKALEVVADIAHGDPKNTKITQTRSTLTGHLKSRRQLHGIALGMAVTATEGTVDGIDVSSLANPELLQQARAHMAGQVPNVSQEQIDATITMVGTVVHEKLEVDFCQDTPCDNFLAGSKGLLHTSAFLRQLSAVGIVRVPTTLSTPNPGFFGPAWNESAEQATSVHDLFDYMGCAVPAWLFFAHYELRTGPGKDQQIKIPDLHMDTLMPFWKLLQNAMDRNRVTVALAIAVQAALLSVIRVNGQKRCMRVQVTARAGFAKALKNTQAAIELLAGDTSKNTEGAKRNLKHMEWWLNEWNKRATTAPPGSGDDVRASRQRDQAMLQTPWVVGQQLIVISCGYGLECGVSNLDNIGQLSLTLHLYNAMRAVDIIESLPLLERLMDEVGTNKAVFFAGRPTCNFMKHWYHRMGMASDTKSQRKLTGLETQDLSTAFRRAALADFSDLSIDEHADPLQLVLDGIRTAFTDDKFISFDINVLGSQLAALPEIMIEAMQLQAEVEKTIAEQMVEHMDRGGGKKRGQRSVSRGGGEQSNRDLNRRHAVHEALVGNIMMPCEYAVTDKSQPFLQSANSKLGPIDRMDLPPFSREQRQKLDKAAQTLKEYVEGLSDSSHRLL